MILLTAGLMHMCGRWLASWLFTIFTYIFLGMSGILHIFDTRIHNNAIVNVYLCRGHIPVIVMLELCLVLEQSSLDVPCRWRREARRHRLSRPGLGIALTIAIV